MAIELEEIGVRNAEPKDASEPDAKAAALVTYWVGQIDAAKKREEKWRKEAQKLIKLFEADKRQDYQFNILYSNTETAAPALYNTMPRPVVKRRYQDKDPMGLQAAKIGERLLSFMLDDGGQESPDFNTVMEAAVQAALVPGRGIPWVKYDAQFGEVEAEAEEAAEGAADADPDIDPAQPAQRVTNEYVCVEEVPWDNYLEGYAKSWAKVPWIARKDFMTRSDLIENFQDLGRACPTEERPMSEDDDADGAKSTDSSDGTTGVKTAEVYQIWDKARRKVLHICPEYKDAPLKEVDDPLELDGFYPCPEPLRFFRRLSSRVPVPLYAFYEEQAKELNRITLRINKVISALKVRGFYDNQVGEIKDMLTADDNTLIPANGAALGAQGAGIDKAIWLMPLEKLIQVLQQLYVQREQIKQVIYEINGISDILRGATVASETATAQQIKSEWGSLRLKRSQKAVQTLVRDTLRIMLEIGVHKLPPEKIKKMVGSSLPMEAEKQQAQMMIQQIQMQAQQAAMIAQQQAAMMPPQMGPNGQPVPPQQPPPPQIPPELQAAANSPSFESVLAILQDDLQRSYKIDIETNSTIDAEATEDKKDIAEMMNAMGQFLNGVQPMVDNGTLPFDIAKEMLLAVTRRYRFGGEIEDKLLQMVKPPPKQDPKAQADAAKAQAEIQGIQAKTQASQVENQGKQQLMQSELQVEQQRLQLERERFQLEREKMMMDREQMIFEHNMAKQKAQLDMQVAVKKAQMATKPKPATA